MFSLDSCFFHILTHTCKCVCSYLLDLFISNSICQEVERSNFVNNNAQSIANKNYPRKELAFYLSYLALTVRLSIRKNCYNFLSQLILSTYQNTALSLFIRTFCGFLLSGQMG